MDSRIRKFLLVVIIPLFAVFVAGCDMTNSSGIFTLSTTTTPEEGGTVSPSGGDYEVESEVELEAEPAEGYRFVRWDGDLNGSANPDTLTFDGDKQVSAVFEVREYPLRIETEGEGRVKEEIIEQAAKDDYEHGTTVQLTAEPHEGWKFVRWEGDLEEDSNPVTLHIEEEKQVTAVFERKEYALNIEIEGGGAVSEEVVRDKSKDYEHGTVVKLTAEPEEGWTFTGWKGDLEGEENPEVITIEEEKQVTAVFERQVHTLSTDAEGEGTISEEEVDEEEGKSKTVETETIPHPSTSPGNNIHNTPDRRPPAASTTPAGDGKSKTTAKAGESDYEHGTTVQLTAEPTDGWTFAGWEGDLEGEHNPATIEMTSDKNVAAVFEKEIQEHTISVSADGEGTVSLDPDKEEFEQGEEVTLTAEPEDGWIFARWEGDHGSTENPVTITVNSDKEITAVFEIREYPLNIDTKGEGSVNEEIVEDKAKDYEHGTTVRLTAEAADGWEFDRWEGYLEGTENPETITVDEEKSVTAVFETLDDDDGDGGTGGGGGSGDDDDDSDDNEDTNGDNDEEEEEDNEDENEEAEEFTISTSTEGEGSVAVDPEQERYGDGEEVTVTAEPADGWSFSHWGEGDFSGDENPVTFNIDQDKEITAVFETATVSHSYIEGVTPEDLNPDNAERTYPVIQADWPGPGGDKRWLGWNLGATDAPVSINDDNTNRAGWYFQFNRLQGYRHDGEGNEKIDNFPVSDVGAPQHPKYDSDWIDNDPCTESLGDNWRVPNREEWEAVILANAGNELDLHFTGSVSYNLGALFGLGDRGSYWTSTQYIDEDAGSTNAAYAISVSENYDLGFNILHMRWGITVRCIED